MKLKLNAFLLSLIAVAVTLPAQAQAYDGLFMAKRESLRDRRETREIRKDRQEAQQVKELREERERESAPGYGYGYERRHEEGDAYRKDERGRR